MKLVRLEGQSGNLKHERRQKPIKAQKASKGGCPEGLHNDDHCSHQSFYASTDPYGPLRVSFPAPPLALEGFPKNLLKLIHNEACLRVAETILKPGFHEGNTYFAMGFYGLITIVYC